MLLEAFDLEIHATVERALAEDAGDGDVTAQLVPDCPAGATVSSRQMAVICGAPWFDAVFQTLDPDVKIQWHVTEGQAVTPDQTLCTLRGTARGLLTGERTALNFLQTLSGTATLARRYADAATGFAVRILDTRKTLPGLRRAQKYAVRVGGCHNHRFGLFDGILIKENHLAFWGSPGAAIEAAREQQPDLPVEVEVENPGQLKTVLEAGAHRVLLDNFTVEELREAVKINDGRARLEASGGIDNNNVAGIAATGVDDISVGALTKDVAAVDLSMTVFPID